jgi:Na+-transporting methylmalonyl-CoA/oxaloacetate decarboxylase beta subunit
MNRTIWKTVFFIVLTIFALLSALLIAFVFFLLTMDHPGDIGIIGGADLPTFYFLLQKIVYHSPITYIWLGTLLTVVISLIGWRTSIK